MTLTGTPGPGPITKNVRNVSGRTDQTGELYKFIMNEKNSLVCNGQNRMHDPMATTKNVMYVIQKRNSFFYSFIHGLY